VKRIAGLAGALVLFPRMPIPQLQDYGTADYQPTDHGGKAETLKVESRNGTMGLRDHRTTDYRTKGGKLKY
jgi:hypothetical protein